MATAYRKRKEVLDYSQRQFVKRGARCSSKDAQPSKRKSNPFALTLNFPLDRRDQQTTGPSSSTEPVSTTQARAPSVKSTPNSARKPAACFTPEKLDPHCVLIKSASKSDVAPSYQTQYYIDKIYQLSQIIEQKDTEIARLQGVVRELRTAGGKLSHFCTTSCRCEKSTLATTSRGSSASAREREHCYYSQSFWSGAPARKARLCVNNLHIQKVMCGSLNLSGVKTPEARKRSSALYLVVERRAALSERKSGLKDQLESLKRKIQQKLAVAEGTIRKLGQRTQLKAKKRENAVN